MQVSSKPLIDLLLPGDPNDPQLRHADPSDQIFVCPPDLGTGYVQHIDLTEDCTLAILDYTLCRDLLIDMVGQGDRIEVEFHLAGPRSGHSLYVPAFRLRQVGLKRSQRRFFKVEIFFRRKALLDYVQRFLERLLPQAQMAVEQTLQAVHRHQVGSRAPAMDKEMLRRVFHTNAALPSGDTLPLNPSMDQLLSEAAHNELLALEYAMCCPITAEMGQRLDQILHCPHRGEARLEHLKRNALELAALRLEAVSSLPLKETNLGCAWQAAALLRSQLVNPPSLESLARQVGTNRLTLTRSFRTLYRTPPFGYLRDCRLTRARRLLMTSELSITEVAAAVGYSSRSRFATAFRKRTGLNPKAFQMRIG
ncbi:MAG: helix-turn-helix transcriptional regulator [Cyanophyceae cyanobacterium]